MTQRWAIFKTLLLLYTKKNSFYLNIMHALGAVDFRICLAQTNPGYSIPAQGYDFSPHLRKLDILDFTLSHMQLSSLTFTLGMNPPVRKSS